MTCELEFGPGASKEWRKLGNMVKAQSKKKLADVLLNPKADSTRLNDLPNYQKIEPKPSGFRLVYQVRDEVVVVFVAAMDKRGHSAIYHDANKRLQ